MVICKSTMTRIKNRLGDNVDDTIIHELCEKVLCDIITDTNNSSEFREYEKDVLKFKFKLTNIKRQDIVIKHNINWSIINRRYSVLLDKVIRRMNVEYCKDIPKYKLTIQQIIDICNIKGYVLTIIKLKNIKGYNGLKHYLLQGKLSTYQESGTGFGLNTYEMIQRHVLHLERYYKN